MARSIIRMTLPNGTRIDTASPLSVREHLDLVRSIPAHARALATNGSIRGGRTPHAFSYALRGTIYWVTKSQNETT
jgi:hypothetical protein